jgi:alanine racemase
MHAFNITPVLNSPEDIALWAWRAPSIVHIDTGMNRLGLGGSATEKFIEKAGDGAGHTILSHFASADLDDTPLTARQHAAFDAVARRLPKARRSLANSAGIFRDAAYHYDLVRPGMALYGLNPVSGANPMRPVVSLAARILQTRDVRAGETCGYCATYAFPRDTATATLALGYADGIPRSLSNSGAFYIDGVACPIRGRVSMDLVIIEVGHLKRRPQAGEYAEILGPHQDADTLAASAGTIGYEILTGLGPRYTRVYEEDALSSSASRRAAK